MRQQRKFDDLKAYSLQASDGEIGKVQEMYFDDERWSVRYLVVRTGGWLLGREVLIAPRTITGLDATNHQIMVDLTREQVEKSPLVDTKKPVSRHYEMKYYLYYGWEPYWSGGWTGIEQALPGRSPIPVEFPNEPEHPHLRSSEEVRSYGIHARDGEMGQIEDFIVDDFSWKVRYFVIDTHKWLPGKKVLVAPTWVNSIDWLEREIAVDLDRKAIQSAPPYDPSQIIGRDDEIALYTHYGQSLIEDDESSTAPKELRD